MQRYEYDTALHELPDNGGAYVVFPWNLLEEFGKGRVKVNASFDGIPYTGSIVNMGLKNPDGSVCYLIGVLKAIRKQLGKGDGDLIHVVIEPAEGQEKAGREVWGEGLRPGKKRGEEEGEKKSIEEMDLNTLQFFDPHPEALELYAALEGWLYASFPAIQKRVQKTQITFTNRHVFACVSFTRVKRKAELPGVWLTLTLGLPAPLDSDRVAVKTEVYPGRWTHHFVLSRPEELDAQLLSWVREAYDFAERK